MRNTIIKKTGRATYISWALKILAAVWTISAASFCLLHKPKPILDMAMATAIVIIAGGIVAPAIPIDLTKIKVAGKPPEE